VASGTIDAQGSISVVPNPDGAGPGVALSMWSGGNSQIQGNAGATCHLADYLASGTPQALDAQHPDVLDCPAGTAGGACGCNKTVWAISDLASNDGSDILDVDGNVGPNADYADFPSDMFGFMFGIPASNYEQVKHEAQPIDDCADLDPTSTGLYWIDLSGSNQKCDLRDAGSYDNPLFLVVQDGDLHLASNGNIFGIIFLFRSDGVTPVTVTLAGTPTVWGSVVSNVQIDIGAGNFTVRYDQGVIKSLALNPKNTAVGKIPGAWNDEL
jgi:hypothetical protein